jgi:triosephosphate isomerase
MRRRIIAGNWKMHKTISEALAFAGEFLGFEPWGESQAVICPPFPCLAPLAQILEGSGVALGAQDLHWESQGAFTGEVSGRMLRDAGCRYVIVGHSERRQHFGDDDERVSLKTRAALNNDLIPVVCVGECLAERESGRAEEVVVRQLNAAIQDLSPEILATMVVAYEPVWAIGTGRSAKDSDAMAMAEAVRSVITQSAGLSAAEGVRFLYGGSVNAKNAREFLQSPGVDGALVGGASLDPVEFRAILAAAI